MGALTILLPNLLHVLIACFFNIHFRLPFPKEQIDEILLPLACNLCCFTDGDMTV